jgi:aldose 1-epimerase
MSRGASRPRVLRSLFGRLPDGRAVEAVTLDNGRGVSARLIAYGATLQSLRAPDREGACADIVLGHDDLTPYLATPQYFGSTIGRYANRIAGGAFSLDDQTITLARNDGDNALHGGPGGFDKALWELEAVGEGAIVSATFSRTSPDGEEGYPGALTVRVRYHLDQAGDLTIAYEATTDRPTVVNLTNHSYFNLNPAGGDVLDHRLWLAAAAYTPVDPGLIPTGEERPVAGGPFDFRVPTPIGARIRDGGDPQLVLGRGYDHNYVLDGGTTEVPRLAARVEEPVTGRVLELLTTEPGLQVYSGNFLDGSTVGKGGRIHRQSDGFCLEPQRFPDTPNQPAFGSARLAPGETYRQVSVFRFGLL